MAMVFGGPERRLRTRFRVRIPFILKSQDQKVGGMTRNVSLLGISAHTSGPLLLAQPIECILELSKKPESLVTANGTIIRCESLAQPQPDGTHEVGVFFKEFQKRGESVLSKFLAQISHKEQDAIQEGYQELKKRMAARRRRKRMEELQKLRRRKERLRRRRQRLAQQKKQASRRSRRVAKQAPVRSNTSKVSQPA